MFDEIRIESFRSLREVDIELPALSVLIGPNGSGKSNFLDLLSLLAQAGQGQMADGIAARGGFDAIAFRGDPGDTHVELAFPAEGAFQEERAPVRFKFEIRKVGANPKIWFEQVTKGPDPSHPFPLSLMKRDKDGCVFRSIKTGAIESQKALESDSELAIFQVRDLDEYPTPYKVLRQFQEWTLYRDIDVGPDALVRQPGLVRPSLRLAPNGANLSSVLYSIQQQHPATWHEIGELLETAHPAFHSITFPPEGGDGKVVLRWWERPYEREGGFSASYLSDGTLKLLCLLAVLKNPNPPPLICIDEPELGLHPDWVKLVAELLQSAAAHTQVIVATHSPHIVAGLAPDQVIVTERENGETRLRRLKEDELSRWLNEFNLADLWLAGHLGGRP